MAKMSKKLVAMCSVAVGLIYAGAYTGTASQANPPNTLSPPGDSSVSGTVVSGNSNAGNSNSGESSTGNAPSNPTVRSSSASAYKDGTYSGFGSDRRGTLQVAVTIRQGKISDVAISNYDMRYSESYIDPILPQEVVKDQNDNVDVVSGATASSENFQMAVQQALDLAKQG